MFEENKNSDTERDVRPVADQESRENVEANDIESNDETDESHNSDARIIDEQTNTTGAGSSQRNRGDTATGSVGPLDADLAQLPSQKRRDRGSNLTGPGLG